MTPPTTQELKARLDAALKKRDDLSLRIQRVLGQLDASQKGLDALRTECQSKGVDPDKIPEAIQKLEHSLVETLGVFEAQLVQVETALGTITQARK